MRKVHSNNSAMLVVKNAHAASAMIPISSRLTKTINVFLSSLSASWPLVAENSRNGRMNSAPITSPASDGGSQLTCNW
ncbi:hypothetical protein FQZ97_1020820 [compost metagenome]